MNNALKMMVMKVIKKNFLFAYTKELFSLCQFVRYDHPHTLTQL